jgi:hypothetical protein
MESRYSFFQVEEFEAIPFDKIYQGKAIYAKACDFQKIFYFFPKTVKVRILSSAIITPGTF